MSDMRRIVLDVLKPHDPSLIEFTRHVTNTECTAAATASLIELDNEVQNIKITIEDDDLDYDTSEAAVADLGGNVHSIDQVSYGEYVVENKQTSGIGNSRVVETPAHRTAPS